MQQPTKINESLSVSGQIDLGDIATLAEEGYGTIINNRPDNEEPGQLDHERAAAEASKRGLEYRYQPVTTNTITRREVAAFQNAVLRGPQPVLAHCRSGTRCYLLWGAARALFEGESALKIVAEAAVKGYDLRVLPSLVEKLQEEE
jgi:sulfide:quinone oxidoreductase